MADLPLQLSTEHRDLLIRLAAGSIRHGLSCGEALPVKPGDYPMELQTPRAVFVTLHVSGDLRGCIGTLEAVDPLAHNVAKYAHAAAFADPRFPGITRPEFEQMDIHISILDTPSPMEFKSEDQLLDQLQPGIDGLILEGGPRRGTLLPAAWSGVRDGRDFLRNLKRKAGLAPADWSADWKVLRYTAVCIPERRNDPGP